MAENRPTMAEVSHTNPETGNATGVLFARGRTVVADGGRAGEDGSEESAEEPTAMRDVSHTPPHDADGANRVFERGESEEDEE